MRRTWVIVGAAVAVALSLCCFAILGYWFVHRPFVFTMPVPMVLPRPEWLDDQTASLILWRSQDNTIDSMSVTVYPDMNAGWISSGGHLSGVGSGGSDEEPAPEEVTEAPTEPPARETDNETQERILRETIGKALDYRSLTFSVRGGIRRDREHILVTPAEFRRFDALLKEHDILDAIRECWKDNPAVMKRLDALTAEPE